MSSVGGKIRARRIDEELDLELNTHIWDEYLKSKKLVLDFKKIPPKCYSPTRIPVYCRSYKDLFLYESSENPDERSRYRRAKSSIEKLKKKKESFRKVKHKEYMEFFDETAEFYGTRLYNLSKDFYEEIAKDEIFKNSLNEKVASGVGYGVKFLLGVLAGKFIGQQLDSEVAEYTSGFTTFILSHVVIDKGWDWYKNRKVREFNKEKRELYEEAVYTTTLNMQQWSESVEDKRTFNEKYRDMKEIETRKKKRLKRKIKNGG